MRIDCPCCGLRYSSEFTYLGDAAIARPADDDKDRAKWFAYLFHRRNPKGWHRERWQHTGGCRSIIEVERNTVTHEIRSVKLSGPWSDSVSVGKAKVSKRAGKAAASNKKDAESSE